MAPEQILSPEHESASRICTDLHRAYRSLRLYPADHPTAAEAIDRLALTIVAHVEAQGSITLEVEECRLLYDGEPVYSYETSRDNLAFLMFRDGIRSLSFQAGLGADEVGAFADCLAHADDLADSEQDLVTSLWERDFTHIDYRVADPFLEGEVLREGTIDALRELVLHRLSEVPRLDPAVSARVNGLVAIETDALDPHSLALTAAEIEHGKRIAEDRSNLLDDFALVLLELAGGMAGQSGDDEALTRSLIMLVEAYLQGGNLEGPDLVFGRLQELEAQGRCPAGLAGTVVSAAVTEEGLGRILQGIGRAPADEVARVERFLAAAVPSIQSTALELLADTEDRAVRKILLAALGSAGDVSGELLEPLLQDPRWYVVRNAVQLAAGSHDPAIVGQLERVLRHHDVRVRRELMRTLDSLGGERALGMLNEALIDEDSSVRTLAVRGLGRLGHQQHEAIVLEQVRARDFGNRPPEEIEAFLIAYADLAKERALPLLDDMWRRRRFSARPTAVRLGALRALGAIPGPVAQAILREAAGSGDAQVKSAATRALYEAQARRSVRFS